jgi:2-methylcitrate dehydratase PrpD
VALRVAAARDFTALGAYSTGRWCGYGAAAAAGWLRRMPAGALAHALAIAGVQAPNQFAAGTSGYSRLTGNSVKEGIPWATVTGITAADLAAAGYTGPEDILDHAPHYDAARILDGLGDPFLIERTYFKPYSVCRWAHAAIDGVGALMAAHDLPADALQAIEIHTFERALRLKNHRNPPTLLDAQYSVPYCVALRAVAGAEALLPLEEAALGRPQVAALAERVSLHLDPALDARFPAATPARVVLVTAAGRFERLVGTPMGEPDNPLTTAALIGKFRAVAGSRMPEARQAALLTGVESLAAGEAAPLLAALAAPLGR